MHHSRQLFKLCGIFQHQPLALLLLCLALHTLTIASRGQEAKTTTRTEASPAAKTGFIGTPKVFILPPFCSPTALAVRPFGHVLYIVSHANGIQAYHAAQDGSLKAVGEPLKWMFDFSQFVVDKMGIFGYALSTDSNTVYPIQIAQDGSVTGDMRVSQDTDPTPDVVKDAQTEQSDTMAKNTHSIALSVSPNGLFLYLANGIGTITQYRIMTDGTFQFLQPATVPIPDSKYRQTKQADYLPHPPVTVVTCIAK